ncbi:MAG TPA: hypothetical protein DCX34_18525 [Roseovarius sp.]|jgi:hypothetical protein|nr:hypothetical protein [Roseovarius sp.]|tara:strand:- start:650 stop:895 length:246 start_codon:yes stop_codon:yes gene_type:complete
MTKEQLLKLAKTYASHAGLALSTVSTYAADAGGFFKGLEGEASCTIRKMDRVVKWFDRHWPEDLEWPSDIPRPSRTKETTS